MPSLRQRISERNKCCYAVIFGLRSGSTMLCDDLRGWGFGVPTEYFQEPLYFLDDRPAAEYVLEVIDQQSGPWFGFKINWHQANSLMARLAAEGECSPDASLWSVFPGLKTIELTRTDKVLQAISAWRASRTDVWHVGRGEAVDPGRPDYNFDEIKEFFDAVITEEWMWADTLRRLSVKPCSMTYEEYLLSREAHMVQLASYLGAPEVRGPIVDQMEVMRDDWSTSMADKFRLDTHTPNHEYWNLYQSVVRGERPSGDTFAA